MSQEEYLNYFMKNNIKITGSSRTANNRKGKSLKNNNSELTLKPDEEELKNFTITEDLEYKQKYSNERQYIVDINNDTENNYSKIRGNIFLGEKNKLLEVSPSEIMCSHNDNATFELPFWVELPAKSKLTFYIIVQTDEENFNPDITLSATKN